MPPGPLFAPLVSPGVLGGVLGRPLRPLGGLAVLSRGPWEALEGPCGLGLICHFEGVQNDGFFSALGRALGAPWVPPEGSRALLWPLLGALGLASWGLGRPLGSLGGPQRPPGGLGTGPVGPGRLY